MEVYPTHVPWNVEEYFEKDFEILVVSGMVFGTLMCGVFDVLDILNNLRVLDQEFENKPHHREIFLVNPFMLICEASSNSLQLKRYEFFYVGVSHLF